MGNKKLLRKIAAVGGAICLTLTILASPVATMSAQAAPPNNEEASPNYAIIEWRYKIENGKVYRRLYNYTVNNWVGEWEYVCPA